MFFFLTKKGNYCLTATERQRHCISMLNECFESLDLLENKSIVSKRIGAILINRLGMTDVSVLNA